MAELPGPLRHISAFPFVGRAAELEALRSLLPTAAGEGLRMALLGGEAGSGKSRLVREVARASAADGALVLYGACDAVVRTPYGPFVEALDQLARATDPEVLLAAAGPAAGELTRLLPDLSLRLGSLPPPLEADPDTERHRLHTAVVDLLTAITRERPALLVLEDGHWADGPTLLLLRHLARAATGARMLLIATFRDADADVPAALAETLAELRRADQAIRLRLEGLSDGAVADFVHAAAGGEPGPQLRALAVSIHELTGGNPFLVCELWRALVETGAVERVEGQVRLRRTPAELGSPESVREVVSQRLARLGPRTRELLELAATAGSELDLGLLRRAAGLDEAELLAALDDAMRNGMLEELGARRLACRFTHELVRRALYDRLSGARRAELHLRVGEALEGVEPRSGRVLADLAHHFAAATPLGGPRRAVEYNLAAARAAASTLAFAEAADRLRVALELGIDAPEERGEALLALGDASHRGGKALDALEAFSAAAAVAREIGAPELLARAAIGYEDACWRPGIVGEGSIELLQEAAAALAGGASSLRVRLLGGLARAFDEEGHQSGGESARTAAIAMARELDDRAALATVLMRSYWSRGTSSLTEILAMLTEAFELARELGDTEILAEAMAWRVPTLVALCDLDGARAEIRELLATAEQTGQPFMTHVADHYGSAIALCDGDLVEAERLALRSYERGRFLTGRDASAVHGVQMFSIRREQGRLAELAPVVRVLAAGREREGPWRPGLAALLAELGMQAEARRELARLAADGLDVFRSSLWLGSLVYVAEASAAVGDEEVAALVYPELEQFAGANVMIGHLVTCYGAADRYRGMLAATLGDAALAEEHFERALELNRRMGAHTWAAHTAYQYARLLRRRGPGARRSADALAREAAALAERLALPGLLAKVRALGSPAAAAVAPDGLSPREVQILALVAEGRSNREIGEALSISEHTAANHVRSILRKTGSSNRTEAASYAHRRRLVPA
ncbi:MAG TPA: AAA family ATPase [Solirubrobacteraceae bacterium]|nr:AAA family ATPase [Solirubrobacteraceae bacterium]